MLLLKDLFGSKSMNRKKYFTAIIFCGCLLIGSLYPKLLMEHHVKLIGTDGQEITEEMDDIKEIPVRLEFRLLRFFR